MRRRNVLLQISPESETVSFFRDTVSSKSMRECLVCGYHGSPTLYVGFVHHAVAWLCVCDQFVW